MNLRGFTWKKYCRKRRLYLKVQVLFGGARGRDAFHFGQGLDLQP